VQFRGRTDLLYYQLFICNLVVIAAAITMTIPFEYLISDDRADPMIVLAF